MLKNKSSQNAGMFRYVKKRVSVVPIKQAGNEENKEEEEQEKKKPKYFQKN